MTRLGLLTHNIQIILATNEFLWKTSKRTKNLLNVMTKPEFCELMATFKGFFFKEVLCFKEHLKIVDWCQSLIMQFYRLFILFEVLLRNACYAMSFPISAVDVQRLFILVDYLCMLLVSKAIISLLYYRIDFNLKFLPKNKFKMIFFWSLYIDFLPDS